MGRPQRAAEGGYVYHVLNRANARMTIFERDADSRGVWEGARRGGRSHQHTPLDGTLTN